MAQFSPFDLRDHLVQMAIFLTLNGALGASSKALHLPRPPFMIVRLLCSSVNAVSMTRFDEIEHLE